MFVEAREEWQERTPGRELLLVLVEFDFLFPAEFLAELCEAESVEEILATDQRDVPKARNRARILFDRHLAFQTFEQRESLRIIL